MDFKEFLRDIPDKIRSLADKIQEKIPAKKRRLAIAVMGIIVFIAICLTFASIIMSKKVPVTQAITGSQGIPPDELFYPPEPDYLPDLLFEREIRQTWMPSDAAEFWSDPAKGLETQWRETAKKTIDQLMEGVR